MATSDLISREAAVREALSWYHKYKDLGDSQALRENTRARLNAYACASAAKNVVCSLMELPAADDGKALSDLQGGVGSGGGGTGGAGYSGFGGEGDA